MKLEMAFRRKVTSWMGSGMICAMDLRGGEMKKTLVSGTRQAIRGWRKKDINPLKSSARKWNQESLSRSKVILVISLAPIVQIGLWLGRKSIAYNLPKSARSYELIDFNKLRRIFS